MYKLNAAIFFHFMSIYLLEHKLLLCTNYGLFRGPRASHAAWVIHEHYFGNCDKLL